ncbi:MAG: hypothetical protein Q4G40_08565, partial [Brachybacterium sp.]|nr:hypothetical protein [Brachybacterium sp.]
MVISRTPLHSEHTTAVDLAPGFRSRLGHIIVTGVHREPGRVTAALLTERGIPVIGVSGPGHPVTGSADLDVLEQLPSPVDPGYVPALARIAARYRAAMLIPSTREELCALSAGRAMIEHYGTQVLLAGPGAVMRTADRLHTL